MSFRPRTAVNAAAIALVGLVGLTACQSQPGHRRVVMDLIEAEPNLTAAQRDCMTTALGSFTNEQLDSIAGDNDALDFSQANYVETGSELYQDYVAQMSACYTSEGATATTEPTGTTAATETTAAGADTTEVTGTTEAAGTTAPETTEG